MELALHKYVTDQSSMFQTAPLSGLQKLFYHIRLRKGKPAVWVEEGQKRGNSERERKEKDP
jgi:hypothetical protein